MALSTSNEAFTGIKLHQSLCDVRVTLSHLMRWEIHLCCRGRKGRAVKIFSSAEQNIKEIPQQAERCNNNNRHMANALFYAGTMTISSTQRKQCAHRKYSARAFDGIICTNPFANNASPPRGPRVVCVRVHVIWMDNKYRESGMHIAWAESD